MDQNHHQILGDEESKPYQPRFYRTQEAVSGRFAGSKFKHSCVARSSMGEPGMSRWNCYFWGVCCSHVQTRPCINKTVASSADLGPVDPTLGPFPSACLQQFNTFSTVLHGEVGKEIFVLPWSLHGMDGMGHPTIPLRRWWLWSCWIGSAKRFSRLKMCSSIRPGQVLVWIVGPF